MTDLRQQLRLSRAENDDTPPKPADRQMLMALAVGKIAGICKGYSMASDANQAMADICDALIEYESERAKSLATENGALSSVFAVYAEEARDAAIDMREAKERWA